MYLSGRSNEYSWLVLDRRNRGNVSEVFQVVEELIFNSDKHPNRSSQGIDDHLHPGDPHDVVVELKALRCIEVVTVRCQLLVQDENDKPEEEAKDIEDHANIVHPWLELHLIAISKESMGLSIEETPIYEEVPINFVKRSDCLEYVVCVVESFFVSLTVNDQAHTCCDEPEVLENVPLLFWVVQPNPLLDVLTHSPPVRKEWNNVEPNFERMWWMVWLDNTCRISLFLSDQFLAKVPSEECGNNFAKVFQLNDAICHDLTPKVGLEVDVSKRCNHQVGLGNVDSISKSSVKMPHRVQP